MTLDWVPKWKPRAATDGSIWLERFCRQKPPRLAPRQEGGVKEMGEGPEPKPKNISPSVQQFHVGHNVLLVLQRQNDDAVTGAGKELGVVR